MIHADRGTLNNMLVSHYRCFNTERFWVDELDEKKMKRKGFCT